MENILGSAKLITYSVFDGPIFKTPHTAVDIENVEKAYLSSHDTPDAVHSSSGTKATLLLINRPVLAFVFACFCLAASAFFIFFCARNPFGFCVVD